MSPSSRRGLLGRSLYSPRRRSTCTLLPCPSIPGAPAWCRGEQVVQLLQAGMSEGPLAAHQRKGHLQCSLLVRQQPLQGLVFQYAFDRMGAAHALQSFHDELLGHPPTQGVELLDLPVLDREGPALLAQPLLQGVPVRAAARERRLHFAPLFPGPVIGFVAPGVGVVRQSFDWAPRLARGLLPHGFASSPGPVRAIVRPLAGTGRTGTRRTVPLNSSTR